MSITTILRIRVPAMIGALPTWDRTRSWLTLLFTEAPTVSQARRS